MKNKILYFILGVIVVLIIVFVLLANRTCLVTFDTGGGTLYATERIKCGHKVKRPKNPTMDGYIFIGFYESYYLNNKQIKEVKSGKSNGEDVCKTGYRLAPEQTKCLANDKFNFDNAIDKDITITAEYQKVN